MDLSLNGVEIETDGMDEFRQISSDHEKLVDEGIPGVGESEAAKLLKEVRSLEEIVRRDANELAQADGISEELAYEVHHHFHN